MKFFKILGIGCVMALASCHSVKKTQSTLPPSNTEAKPISKKDSAKLAHDLLSNIKDSVLDYQTISGKLDVSIKSANLNQSVNANLRSAKDSLIWMSLTGPFNIEGARAKISVDSAIVINKLNSTVEKRSIAYIQNLIHQPFSFADIQNILTGRALLTNGDLLFYNGNPDGTWNFVWKQGNIQNVVTIDPNNDRVTQNLLTDISHPQRTCKIQYGNFQNTSAGWMPFDIRIDVQDQSPIKVELSYKQANFNQTLDYPFNIPAKYSVRQ